MRESKAWLILAEEVDSGCLWTDFLCCILEDCEIYRDRLDRATRIAEIPEEMRQRMIVRIRDSLGGLGPAYYHHEDGKLQNRVLACLMFREQALDLERKR